MQFYLVASSNFGSLALYSIADSVCIAYDICALVFIRSLTLLQFTRFHYIEDPT